MANKTEKKSTAKKANAKENFSPKTFMEVIAGHINPKPSNGERVVSLAKERDVICDRIADVKSEIEATKDIPLKEVLTHQLKAMQEYKRCLNIRIKGILDKE